jgi:hypothetical protein
VYISFKQRDASDNKGGRVKPTYQLKRDLHLWTQVPFANNGISIPPP